MEFNPPSRLIYLRNDFGFHHPFEFGFEPFAERDRNFARRVNYGGHARVDANVMLTRQGTDSLEHICILRQNTSFVKGFIRGYAGGLFRFMGVTQRHIVRLSKPV